MASATDRKQTTRRTEEQSATEKRPQWVAGATLICAISSVVGFTYAFAYEAGFAGVFGIPLELIRIDTATILIVMSSVAAVVVWLYFVIDWGYAFWRLIPGGSPYRREAAVVLPFVLIWLALVILFGGRWQYWAWVPIFLLPYVLLTLVFPFVTQRSKTSYWDKLRAVQEADDEVDTLTSVGVRGLISFLGRGGVLLIGVVLFGLALSYWAGEASAVRRADWAVISGKPEKVILRIYGDNVICAALDPTSARLERQLVVVRMGDNMPLTFEIRHLGELRQPGKARGGAGTPKSKR